MLGTCSDRQAADSGVVQSVISGARDIIDIINTGGWPVFMSCSYCGWTVSGRGSWKPASDVIAINSARISYLDQSEPGALQQFPEAHLPGELQSPVVLETG